MKKLFFAFMTVALVASATSCNKCGHCQYTTGGNSSATCQSANALTAVAGDGYKQAKANCEANGDRWIVQ